MDIQFADYHGADQAVAGPFADQWRSLHELLLQMPLHLKASDQAGIQGNAIFDPVGTNAYITTNLAQGGWHPKLAIPADLRVWGTDVDFGMRGAVAEVQFSNYPFLLNNVVRSELFYRLQTTFDGVAVGVVFIVTKAGMFPASQSTLYYEQAVAQLSSLSAHNIFTVPVRLVGLFSRMGEGEALWCTYSGRYAREPQQTELRRFVVQAPAGGRVTASNRCRIHALVDPGDL